MKNNKKPHRSNKEMPHHVEGIIYVSNKGSGLLKLKNSDKTIEISYENLNTACNGDMVLATVNHQKQKEKTQGKIIKIIRRSKKGYSGILKKEKDFYYISPDDSKMYMDIVIPKSNLNKALVGQKVFAVITEWIDNKNSPIGKIEKVLGYPKENNAEMEAIALEKGFSSDFPKEVKKESKEIFEKGITTNDLIDRKDIRNTTTFTIDPADAKDFDDAISFKKLPNNHFEIGVHIADVSHYVRPGTALDEEARNRGTSVYLVDRTIPMLPEELSNGLCSLNEGVDRLTFSAIFELDMKGKIYKEWFGKTIIKSDKRFTYENAQEIIDNKNGSFYDELNILNTIAKKLSKKRFEEGAIIIDQEEVKFKLDENGIPISVYTKVRKDTHKLVEEYMLLANRRVAEFMSQKKTNKNGIFVYRIHDLPNREKMGDLISFLKKLGYHVKSKDGLIPSEEINNLLLKIEKDPLRDTINDALIRTMAKAIYSTKNIGHYGLGFKFYTHFTSPIRRYPDVIVHRLLSSSIDDKKIAKEKWSLYEEISTESSMREKEASEAERTSIRYKQVEYMSKHIGEKFEGIITSVTEWGLFVEEKETKCEGMIRLKDMTDDFYVFDKKLMYIKGQKHHKKYTLGDKIKFEVINTDLTKKIIDYGIIKKQKEY